MQNICVAAVSINSPLDAGSAMLDCLDAWTGKAVGWVPGFSIEFHPLQVSRTPKYFGVLTGFCYSIGSIQSHEAAGIIEHRYEYMELATSV
jgi:hypothetical protein